jgi:hypothetical protein
MQTEVPQDGQGDTDMIGFAYTMMIISAILTLMCIAARLTRIRRRK